jgi:hypothetical protein
LEVRQINLMSVGPSGRVAVAAVSAERIVAAGELLYFSGSDGRSAESELWRSDGTPEGPGS